MYGSTPRGFVKRVASYKVSRVYLGVRTCELFLCFVPFVFLGFIVVTSLFSLLYVTSEFNRFLHRGCIFIIEYLVAHQFSDFFLLKSYSAVLELFGIKELDLS